MDDVKAHFTRATDRLKEHLRQELNTLLLRYLSDIISGAHNNVDLSKIAAVHDSSLAAMVSQIDEQYLPKTQRQELYNFITRLRSGDVTRPDTKVVAHFVGKLLDLHTAQQAQESRINSFVNTCNSYLENKQCVFDKQHFRLFIQPTPSSQDDALDLKNLSSGEKQIVSLFSEIILRENRKYYVFIDEPELSLSVDWQRRFLQDIVSSGYCAGLIAVTHSPFIFENALDQYAHDLAEFTSPRPVS